MIYRESKSSIKEKVELKETDMLYLKFGLFKVVQKIGKGGFGSVYKIKREDGLNSQIFALKVTHLWEMNPNEFVAISTRAKVEYEVGQISSDHIVNSFAFGYLKGNPFIIMEFCPNGNLTDHIFDYKNHNDYISFCRYVLLGLNDLHKNGIIHRDIKPENLLFSQNGKIKLTDFGISAFISNRITKTNFLGRAKELFGSALYSPPEQFEKSKYFKYTLPTMDVYAFGITLYYLLSGGNLPFGDFNKYEKDPDAYLKKKVSGQFTPLSYFNKNLNPIWETFVSRCLHPNPNNRYKDTIHAMQAIGINSSMKIPNSTNQFNSSNILKIVYGEVTGKIIDLDQIVENKSNCVVTLGRSNNRGIDNDISLIETYTTFISKAHSTLERHDSNWVIRDGQYSDKEKSWKYSLNGTLINSSLLFNTNKPIELKNGDQISIGDYRLKFYKKSVA